MVLRFTRRHGYIRIVFGLVTAVASSALKGLINRHGYPSFATLHRIVITLLMLVVLVSATGNAFISIFRNYVFVFGKNASYTITCS